MMRVYMICQKGLRGPLAVFDAHNEAKKYITYAERAGVEGLEILAYQVHDDCDRFWSGLEDAQ